jgi:hypothetical protein
MIRLCSGEQHHDVRVIMMRTTIPLLDGNMLLALAWRTADAHLRATEWFTGGAGRAFATCPVTESGFVRIASNPAFYSEAVGVASGCEILSKIASTAPGKTPGSGN